MTLKPSDWILLGTAITIIGAVITGIATWRNNIGSSNKSSTILQLSEDNLKLSTKSGEEITGLKAQNETLIVKSERQAETIDKLRSENTELYGKLMEKGGEIYGNLTGAGTTMRFELANTDFVTNRASFAIWVSGKHPLRNVQLRIVDLATMAETELQYAILDPKQCTITLRNKIVIVPERGVALNIFASANARDYIGCIRLKWIGKWIHAVGVMEWRTGQYIYFKKDEDYPGTDPVKIFQEKW